MIAEPLKSLPLTIFPFQLQQHLTIKKYAFSSRMSDVIKSDSL